MRMNHAPPIDASVCRVPLATERSPTSPIETLYEMRLASWVREVTSNFRNTFRK